MPKPRELRDLRISADLTLEEASQVLGVTVKKLESWEDGADDFSERYLRFVAAGKRGDL